ncbi:hypothetical protein Zmor_019261 [Zophobas morio]|uniref:Uncharacterized protein n=1 Tax=Zophobas morio TaxID=2755281 RepID=A0AA38I417_9CUCU|nr:hypothetical protein Zmor_019261 [Zophobas morio]
MPNGHVHSSSHRIGNYLHYFPACATFRHECTVYAGLRAARTLIARFFRAVKANPHGHPTQDHLSRMTDGRWPHIAQKPIRLPRQLHSRKPLTLDDNTLVFSDRPKYENRSIGACVPTPT